MLIFFICKDHLICSSHQWVLILHTVLDDSRWRGLLITNFFLLFFLSVRLGLNGKNGLLGSMLSILLRQQLSLFFLFDDLHTSSSSPHPAGFFLFIIFLIILIFVIKDIPIDFETVKEIKVFEGPHDEVDLVLLEQVEIDALQGWQ
jgi:hypothetical protein